MTSPLEVLPLALVMIAGPQLISSVFLATTPNWGKNSLAYVGGAALSITATVTAGYLVAKGAKSAAGSRHTGTVGHVIDAVILALLLILVVRVYVTRAESKPPRWMSKLQAAEPKFAFGLGMVLLGLFPADLLISVTSGLHLGRHGDPWWQCLPFVALTILFLALPSIAVAILGKRAATALPKIRDWMTGNAWVVSEIALAVFIAIMSNNLANG